MFRTSYEECVKQGWWKACSQCHTRTVWEQSWREHVHKAEAQHLSNSSAYSTDLQSPCTPFWEWEEEISFGSSMCERFRSSNNPSYTQTAAASGSSTLADNCTWCFTLSSYLFLLLWPFVVDSYWSPSVIGVLHFPYSIAVISNFEPFKENINWL